MITDFIKKNPLTLKLNKQLRTEEYFDRKFITTNRYSKLITLKSYFIIGTIIKRNLINKTAI